MKRIVLLGILIALLRLEARAEFRKSYFVATKPGAWARYAVAFGGPSTMEYRYRRLPDENGSTRLEFAMEFLAGQARGKRYTYSYWLKPGFGVEKDVWSYGKWLGRMSTEAGSGKPTESSAAELEALRADSPEYATIVSFSGSEAIDGKPCDHYAYRWSTTGKPPRVESGDFWLNDAVPFGIVRRELKISTTRGETVSSMQIKLVDSGPGGAVAPKGRSKP